jgi:FG-GAP-like repeat
MKCAWSICLCQCFITTFLLAQPNYSSIAKPRPWVVSLARASQADPRAQVRLRSRYGRWPLGFEGATLDANGIFMEAPTYSSGTGGAVAATAADVNGDGKLDLVLANGGVGVLLGNGDGTFQPVVSYGSGGDDADSVAVADVNGDGIPDLLVANECASDCEYDNNGSVGVLLGNADGTFQAAASYYTGGDSAYSVTICDLNGDGKPDLIVANLNSVGVLLGNGDGTFKTAVTY